MERGVTHESKQRCAWEYERLADELKKCHHPSKAPTERHRCYRTAAKRSGRRAKRCITGG